MLNYINRGAMFAACSPYTPSCTKGVKFDVGLHSVAIVEESMQVCRENKYVSEYVCIDRFT